MYSFQPISSDMFVLLRIRVGFRSLLFDNFGCKGDHFSWNQSFLQWRIENFLDYGKIIFKTKAFQMESY